jgi:hypothetical protein
MKHKFLNHLLLTSPLFLSICVPPLARTQNTPARIELVMMEGENATTGVRQRVTRDPVIRVEDDDHRPVMGAVVVFALPVSGASGEFVNGSKTLSVVTQQDGLAAARGIRTNEIPGKLQIYATASYRGLRARTLINQFVEAGPNDKKISSPELQTSKSGNRWKWVALSLVAAGGAGAGIYYGLHSNSSPTPVSISVGSVTFGSPR